MAFFSSKGKLTRDGFTGWIMAAPAMMLIGLFLITPFLLGLGFSFTNQRLTSPNPTEFVGVENYTRLLGIGVLMIEHDMRFIMQLCPRIVALNYGEVIASGQRDAVANDPAVIEAYMGRRQELAHA